MEAREAAVMEVFKGKATATGEAGLDPDERPAKLLCQGDGSGSQRAVFAGFAVGDAGAGSSSGATELGCPSAFINASLDVGSVFDCSALSGALESDLLVASEVADISDEEAPADVFVPGAARPVVISKQLIVKEIAHRLHLKIHDFGTFDEPDGLMRGWIEIDVPRCLADEPMMKEKFVGGDALGRYAAMESVSEDVIKQLCRASGVIVKDVNYPQVEKLKGKLAAEKRWFNLFSGKLQAKTEEARAIRCGYVSVVAHVKTICKKFKDVLPIETCGEEDVSLEMDNVKVNYNGPRQPVTRMDELASELVSLAKKSVDQDVLSRDVKEMAKVPYVPFKRKRYRCRG